MSISCWFFHVHAIFTVFPGYHEILFWCLNVLIVDSCFFLWNLSLLALTLCLIYNLFSGLCFGILNEILASTSWFLFFFLNSFEVHFNSPPTSKLVDGNMKRGLYGFILILLLVLCSCCFPCFWFVMEDGYYFWGIKVSWVEWDCGLWVLRRGEGKLWDPICMSRVQVEFISGILWNSEELPTSCKHLSLHSWSYGMPLSLAHLSSTAPCKCHACYLQCYHSAWDGGAWIRWKSSNMASFRWVR